MYEQSISYFYDSVCKSFKQVNDAIDDLGLSKNFEVIYNKIDSSFLNNDGVNEIISIIDIILDVCERETYLTDRNIFNPAIKNDVDDMLSKLELFKNIITMERNSLKEPDHVYEAKVRLENTPIKLTHGVDSEYHNNKGKTRFPNLKKY